MRDRPAIDWFSPLPPARSDIAHFTMRLLPALTAKANVRLWTDQRDWDRTLTMDVEVMRYDPKRLDVIALNRAALVVYNMGNDARFHGGIREALFRFPGVLIAHELGYHHSIVWDYCTRQRNAAGYIELMQRCYGREGREAAMSYLSRGVPSLDELAKRYPFLDLLADAALAVVCHSQEVTEAARARGVPTRELPLPFPVAGKPVRTASAEGPLKLVQFGYIGPSRRVFSILAAVARLRAKQAVHLRIFGELWDEAAVRREIRRRRLDDSVSIEGFVPESELDAAIRSAHLVFNLRYPSVGEASGSQLRIWAAAAPAVVTRTGWYGDLPDDTVIKIDPKHEAADLDRVLDRLAADRSAFAEIGWNGHRHLSSRHGAEAYVDGLLAMVPEAEGQRGLLALRHLASRAECHVDRLFAGPAKPLLSYPARIEDFCR